MLPALTDRQKAIYDFLLKSIRERGFAPSIQEIGRQFKIASTNGVSDHLKALEKKGYIRRVGKRAIEVVNALGKSVLAATRDVPVVGRVPAGKPFLSEENIEEVITIPSDIGSGKRFALRVKGDSMLGAGILEGDRVIVKQQAMAENGDIVCAMIDGEATLKRFFKNDGVITLKAENEKYPPIVVAEGEFRIVGKIVGLLRKF
jgi:repressor LexA